MKSSDDDNNTKAVLMKSVQATAAAPAEKAPAKVDQLRHSADLLGINCRFASKSWEG